MDRVQVRLRVRERERENPLSFFAEQYISEEYKSFLTLPEDVDAQGMEMIENISAEALEEHNKVWTEFKSACE